MVPVRERHNIVIGILKWRVGIFHDERPAQAINYLASSMRVVPVRADLVYLFRRQSRQLVQRGRHTVNE